jgi:SAM-dependent methyltransferase
MSKYHQIIYGNYDKSRVKSFNKKFIDYLFPGPLDSKKVLEIGSGTGEILMLLGNKFGDACGIDSEVDLNKNRIPYKKCTFDIVFTKSTIEHISNTDHMLQEIKRVLKPGGYVYIFTPAWEYNYKDFYNDYTHVKPFHRKGLQDALKINGFSSVDVLYFYHLPWAWGKYSGDLKWWALPVILWLRAFSFWKWKNKEENIHRPNIRFAQEVQLLGIGCK